MDAAGDIVFTGTYRGTLDFGGGPLFTVSQQADIFLVKLSSSAQHVWSNRFGDLTYGQEANALTTV